MCKDIESCEYKPKLARQPTKRTRTEIRYGQLWAEIEMPKLLEGEKKQ